MSLKNILFTLLCAYIVRKSLGNHTSFPGHPVTILDFTTINQTKRDFVFNSRALENILMHENVINRKISVVSIMGAFRKGKSFLLDYFLRYMYTTVSIINMILIYN